MATLLAAAALGLVGCAGGTGSTTATGATAVPAPGGTGPDGSAGSFPGPGTSFGGTSFGDTIGGGSVPEPAWSGRRTHLAVAVSPGFTDTWWHYRNADGSIDRTGWSTGGLDLPVDDVSRDFWIWVDNTEHMEGIQADDDGLTTRGVGCGGNECTHVVVTPEGAVQLPNRRNRTIDTLSFRFWSVHDRPAPTNGLPVDAPPLDDHGEPTGPAGEPDLPVTVTTDPTPAPDAPSPAQPILPQDTGRPQMILSLVARDGHHVQDVDPDGRGGFDLRPSSATPPGTYWAGVRIYSADTSWVTTQDDDGVEPVVDGIVRRSALCETDGCVRLELGADGRIRRPDGAAVTALHLTLQPMPLAVYEQAAGAPDVGPAPAPDRIAAPPGSVVVQFRLGAPGQPDAPAVRGYGASMTDGRRSFGVDPLVTRGVSTVVFTDVPAGDFRLTTGAGMNVSNVSFTDATGAVPPYEGLGVHPTGGGEPLVVTLYGFVPPPPPPTSATTVP